MTVGGLPTGPGPDALGEGIPGGLPTLPAVMPVEAAEGMPPGDIAGRSPGQLVLARLRRDRVALASAALLVLLGLVAVAAPLIARLYGTEPHETFPGALDRYGYPYGYLGGVTAEHWLGVQPKTSHDLFVLVVYGLRTSLVIALVSAVLTIAVGVVAGVVAGYAGGLVDAVISWVV